MTQAQTRKPRKTSLSDVSKVSELKKQGWLAEQRKDGQWTAAEVDGVRSLGPAATIGALETLVKLETEKGGNGKAKSGHADIEEEGDELKLKRDSKGQAYLTGQEPRIPAKHRDLAEAIKRRYEIVTKRVELQATEKEATDLVLELMKKYEDDLETDPESGNKTYRVGDILCELETKEKESIKTHKIDQ